MLWGLYYGILLMLEKLFLLDVLAKCPAVLRHAYCAVAVVAGWVLFSVSGLRNVAEWWGGILGAYGLLGTSMLWELQSWSYVSLLPVLVLGAVPVFPWLRMRVEAWSRGEGWGSGPAAPEKGNDFVPPCEVDASQARDGRRRKACTIVNGCADLGLLAVFLLSCISIASGGHNPFIYFQF